MYRAMREKFIRENSDQGIRMKVLCYAVNDITLYRYNYHLTSNRIDKKGSAHKERLS